MVVELREMSQSEIEACLSGVLEGYVAERIAAGQEEESARATATAQHEQFFPDGRPASGHHLFAVIDAGRPVGHLWLGPQMSGTSSTWFIYDIEVDGALRGRGLGRATMEAAESWALEHDGTRLALNVFGPNRTARALYDSLGYQVMATLMFKDLDH